MKLRADSLINLYQESRKNEGPNKIKSAGGKVTMDITEIKNSKKIYEQLYVNTLDYLDKIVKLLET